MSPRGAFCCRPVGRAEGALGSAGHLCSSEHGAASAQASCPIFLWLPGDISGASLLTIRMWVVPLSEGQTRRKQRRLGSLCPAVSRSVPSNAVFTSPSPRGVRGHVASGNSLGGFHSPFIGILWPDCSSRGPLYCTLTRIPRPCLRERAVAVTVVLKWTRCWAPGPGPGDKHGSPGALKSRSSCRPGRPLPD